MKIFASRKPYHSKQKRFRFKNDARHNFVTQTQTELSRCEVGVKIVANW